MRNAIKYILEKRNMKQQQLVAYPYKKQYVSKVINRHYRIPDVLITRLERLLHVPSKFFVDDTGLCKQLNSLDLHELDSYLEAQYFIENEDELQQFPEVEFALREHALSTNITKLQRNIRKDILSVQQVTSNLEALDAQENNFGFYNSILELHRANQLNNDEWQSLFRAFQYVTENVKEESVKKDNALVYGMYVLLTRARELNAAKMEENIQLYEELFGSLTSNFESDDE